MPETPDIEAYIEALEPRVLGQTLQGVRLANPFLLRTVDPPLGKAAGGRVEGVERVGKRIVLKVAPAVEAPTAIEAARVMEATPAIEASRETEASATPLFLVIHLMIAGRLHWKKAGSAIPKGSGLAAFDFATGTLILTEAGTKRRASLHLVRGREALTAVDPGGIDVFVCNPAEFGTALRRENRTLKRALADPRVLSGIGNAYSDEILHRARLSPFKRTRALDETEMDRLHRATVEVLSEWTERLRSEAKESFPDKVTAFRPDMAVHGRFGAPCPVCGAPIQRIVYSENECNYCPVCQTEGRILADRSLSRLLRDDWPRAAHPKPDLEV
jgi:formamidopyrimidine-DNA glycosylase